MGLQVTFDEETTECQIILGDKVIRSYRMKDWKQRRDSGMNSSDPKNTRDYAEIHAARGAPHDDAMTDEENLVGVCWYGYFNSTVEEISKEFAVTRQAWTNSRECAIFVDQLNTLKKVCTWPVTNIVAMATGSFHDSEKSDIIRHRSMLQLASILTVREVLGEPANPLLCVIQDPAYSKLDKEFLASLDLQVVDDPDAFARIDSGSFVLRVGDYAHMSRWICDGVWPAAMFCDDWRTDLSSYEPEYPKGWLDPIPGMFNDYIKKPCIDEKGKYDAVTDPNSPEGSGGDWERVFLFWRKPGLISAKE